MRRTLSALAVVLSPFVAGCAGWTPTATDAATAGRTIACAICQATGGPVEQAAAYAEGQRRITEAIAVQAAQTQSEAVVRAIVADLAAKQAEERTLFERLVHLVEAPPAAD